MTDARCAVVVLISGNGTNLQALIDKSTDSNYHVTAVISNNPNAFGLQRARRAGIPTAVLSHRQFRDRETFDTALMGEIEKHENHLIVLAGFMRILSPMFVSHFHGRILNIHPSLLPLYPGTGTHRRVIEAGDRDHGASVHFVTEALDSGPVIVQGKVKVTATDTDDTLMAKVAAREHKIYPYAVSLFASGLLRMEGQQAVMEGKPLPPCGIDFESLSPNQV
ncbi:MAG: phosphoribosylglycinamide formyltransferase [Pseudohongiellaceae bacterium]